jgi:uracil-DNA glycosylase
MRRVRLEALNDFAEWRQAARALLLCGTRPDDVIWEDPAASIDLFAELEDRPEDVATRAVGVVPPRFLRLAEAAICHRETIRFGLLYRVLFRLQKDRALIGVRTDPDISKLYRLAGEVRRDSEKMQAFVQARMDDGDFAAWLEPAHYVLERTARVLVRRVADRRWAILTAYRSAAWDGAQLIFGSGARRADVPAKDASGETWRSFFASIFNATTSRFATRKSVISGSSLRNLSEVQLIASLVRDATQAEPEMTARAATGAPARHARAEARKPEPAEARDIVSLADARAAIEGCTRCPLYQCATQAVFGEGPQRAAVMFVGEQPGDQEDLAGKPFVGPAGQMLDRALDKVGIDRSQVYVTNAVKHFKFEPRGKKRIHQKPTAGEVQACKFWLNLEREFVRPKLVVALGATAVASLMGKNSSITSLRGKKLELPDGATLMVTVHPSYLLRMPDRDKAAQELKSFESDLRAVKAFINRRGDDVRHGSEQQAG